jgi:hypothetical protein
MHGSDELSAACGKRQENVVSGKSTVCLMKTFDVWR